MPEDYKDYYVDISEKLLSYQNVKSKISYYFDTYTYRRNIIARFGISEQNLLQLYLALDPHEYSNENIHDFSGKHSSVKLTIVLSSEKSAKCALDLIDDLAKKNDILKKL